MPAAEFRIPDRNHGIVRVELAVAAFEGIGDPLDGVDDLQTFQQRHIQTARIADKAKDRLVFAQRRMHVKTLRLEPVDELISLFLGNVVLQNHNHVGDLQSTIKNAAQSILCRIKTYSLLRITN